MNDMPTWRQVNVTFSDWHKAEAVAATELAPRLDAEASCWWFIRKQPCWRFRYQAATRADQRMTQLLSQLRDCDQIAGWATVVYEPEVHAFGGPEAMSTAHQLFHCDSRAVLACLRDEPGGRHRRELSLLLCSVMMRAAGLDWYEQGDVWARVADHRKPPADTTPTRTDPSAAVRRLITADSQMRPDAQLARHADWAAAWSGAGHELASLAAAGRLHRGLRDVLAHHVIFGWNRAGLSYQTQSTLACAAKNAVFGTTSATARA